MVNLASVDVQRIQEALQFVFTLQMGLVEIVFATYFLISYLGISSLAGIAVFIILIPSNTVISKVVNTLQVWNPTQSTKGLLM